MWWIRPAAWQPLLFTPGSGFHYSNIGYDILACREPRGGKPLADLYRERIFDRLEARRDRIRPAGSDPGPHARGYGIEPDGTRFDARTGTRALAPKVASSRTPKRPRGSSQRSCALVGVRQVEAMKGDTSGSAGPSPTAPDRRTAGAAAARIQDGGWVDGSGRRVAVLLLNARHWDTAQPLADAAAHDAMARMFCRA